MEAEKEEYIYIMLSKTNTLLGLTIQRMLGVAYNHCSIALDDSLEEIYSVGRKEFWNMFWAGFVVESKSSGFFALHKNADIVLLRFPVSMEEKERLRASIRRFSESDCKYNLLGLLYCYLGVASNRENRLFCSQFVAEVLREAGISLMDKPSSLVRPHDFLTVGNPKEIYAGKIGHYRAI